MEISLLSLISQNCARVSPRYMLYRFVSSQSIWLFGLKLVHRFCHFALKFGIVESSGVK